MAREAQKKVPRRGAFFFFSFLFLFLPQQAVRDAPLAGVDKVDNAKQPPVNAEYLLN